MVDEEHLTRLRLSRKPLGQRVVAWLFLGPNYFLPPRTRIVLEGIENIPSDRRVMFALNHTDRYNYWPFQFQMWWQGDLPYTTTWVKAKYYENKYLGWFFDQCNNIPLPSRGYLILQDARAVLGRKLQDEEYRLLRDLVDGDADGVRALNEATPDLRRVLTEPRRDFDPSSGSYAEFVRRWNDRLMGLVERRTLESLKENDNNLIVFPQGTRSIRLLPGKPGLAQFAVRHQIDIVPVGSMGSEHVYPTANPWAKGGRCLYRIGKPLRFDSDLADCRIAEPYAPFTHAAEKHRATFERVMDRVTHAIDDLLEPAYKLGEHQDQRARADRLL